MAVRTFPFKTIPHIGNALSHLEDYMRTIYWVGDRYVPEFLQECERVINTSIHGMTILFLNTDTE